MLPDHSLLQAALEGLELKGARIDAQIAQIKQALSRTAEGAPTKRRVSKKRVLSPEVRERMAAAQKARWAKVPGEAQGG